MSQSARQAIQNLIENSPHRSKVSRIRELLPDIERAIEHGVRLKAIAATLEQRYFPGLNEKGLQNLLYQARHKPPRDAASKASPQAPGIPDEVRRTPTSKTSACSSGIDADQIIEAASSAAQKSIKSGNALDLLRNR